MENKSKSPVQEIINEEARRYCEAEAAGNSGQMKACFNSIIVRLCDKNTENKILFAIYSKLLDESKYILGVSSCEDLTEYVFLFLHESMDKYDYNKRKMFRIC